MSESGLLIRRRVYPVPGPVVAVCHQVCAPPVNRSRWLVAIAPLLLVAPLPAAVAATSSGFTGSSPVYSAIRISEKFAATLKRHCNGVRVSRQQMRYSSRSRSLASQHLFAPLAPRQASKYFPFVSATVCTCAIESFHHYHHVRFPAVCAASRTPVTLLAGFVGPNSWPCA